MDDDDVDLGGLDWSHMGLYYDRQGQPIDMLRWGQLRHGEADDERDDYVRVGLDTWPSLESLTDPLDAEAVVTISTVWMGLNVSLGSDPPMIFETMIFGGEYDTYCTRYATEEQATEGHVRTVDDIQHGRIPWFLEPDPALRRGLWPGLE